MDFILNRFTVRNFLVKVDVRATRIGRPGSPLEGGQRRSSSTISISSKGYAPSKATAVRDCCGPHSTGARGQRWKTADPQGKGYCTCRTIFTILHCRVPGNLPVTATAVPGKRVLNGRRGGYAGGALVLDTLPTAPAASLRNGAPPCIERPLPVIEKSPVEVMIVVWCAGREVLVVLLCYIRTSFFFLL